MKKTGIYIILLLTIISTNLLSAQEQKYECLYEVDTPLQLNDVLYLSNEYLGFLRNEIFARHGRVFTTEKYKIFFNSQAWYRPDNFYSENKLTAIDKANVKLIQSIENPSAEDSNLENNLIKNGEKNILITVKYRQYIDSQQKEDDEDYMGPDFEIVNKTEEFRSVFSTNNNCIVKGSFKFLPYIDETSPVQGTWRIFNGKLYLRLHYSHSWFDDKSGSFDLYSIQQASDFSKDIKMITDYVFY